MARQCLILSIMMGYLVLPDEVSFLPVQYQGLLDVFIHWLLLVFIIFISF